MQNIVYNIHSKTQLIIGYQGETGSRSVEFTGFNKDLEDSTIYLMMEGIGLYPLLDFAFPVSFTYTQNKGTYEAYLVEKNAEGSFVKKSANFDIVIKHSMPLGEIVTPEKPEFTEWFDVMSELYQRVKTDYEEGKFNGKDGYTPIKGKDYFTPTEVSEFKEAVTPKKGIDYFDGKTPSKGTDYFTPAEVSEFKKAVTPVKGIDYSDGEKGDPGEVTYIENPYDDSILKEAINKKPSKEYVDAEVRKAKPSDYDSVKQKVNETEEQIEAIKEDLVEKVDETADKLEALWKLSEGTVYDFYDVESEAYSVDVPSGAKVADIQSIGGKSVVWNQKVNGDFSKWTFVRCDHTINGDTATFKPTAARGQLYIYIGNYVAHVLFIKLCAKSVEEANLNVIVNDSGYDVVLTSEFKTNSSVKKIINSTDPYVILRSSDVGVDISVKEVQVFDLTAMFGEGNEPTVEQFEAMFPNDYYPYSDNTIIHADVDKAVVRGKNLWDENWTVGSIVANQISPLNYIEVEPNTVYKTTVGCTIYYYDEKKSIIKNEWATEIFTTQANCKYIKFRLPSNYGIEYKNDVAIIKGNNGIYTPYQEPIELPIPQAIRNLEGYGWSAGSVYNEVDFENKKFVQRVGRVNLEDYEWGRHAAFNCWSTATIIGIKKPSTVTTPLNAMSENLMGITASKISNGLIGIAHSSNNETTFVNNGSDDIIPSGTMYCELSEPIITDISSLLEPVEVESGGSITYHQTDDTKHLPIPNKVEYLRSLAEVGA